MREQVIIDRRFHGPPQSGNGGYVCGVVADLMGGPAEVTLRRPPPLDRPLGVVWLDGRVALRDGETVIAEGAPTSVEIDVPDPVAYADAEAASRSYLGFRWHPFPTCFVCGPQRAYGDGLRIFPGRVAGRDLVAAPWTPHASLADADGTVRPEFVWASLDCPGGLALVTESFAQPVVLGRLAAKLLAPVRSGRPHVATGWPLGGEGRRLYSGTALFTHEGELLAVARATWVRLA